MTGFFALLETTTLLTIAALFWSNRPRERPSLASPRTATPPDAPDGPEPA